MLTEHETYTIKEGAWQANVQGRRNVRYEGRGSDEEAVRGALPSLRRASHPRSVTPPALGRQNDPSNSPIRIAISR